MPPAKGQAEASGYDSHAEIRWRTVPKAVSYAIFSDTDAEGGMLLGRTIRNCYLHFPETGQGTYTYHVEAYDGQGRKIWHSNRLRATVRRCDDEGLLDMVQRYTFRYFWDFACPVSGMAYERSDGAPTQHKVTIGGSGFGIMAVITGVERGFISREEGYRRMLKITEFLSTVPRFKGMWAHWYDSSSGQPMAFSEKDDGGDVVESAFMMQGLLTARKYFSRPAELELRQDITRLWEEMDWEFYTQGQNVIYWHYSPKYGFGMNHPVKGYNEALIAYVLAASSPTHPVKPEAYHEGWASWDQAEFSNYSEYYGMMLPLGNKRWLGGPLFFAHYSFLGLCPEGLSDRYADYWQQNVRQSLINRAYCMDNPYGWKGYGRGFWGITACDMVPEGYMAHMPGYWFDRGTIAPTGALSSMPYTPEYSMDVLKNLYRVYGNECFGPYGFYDAVNFSVPGGPVRRTYLAIDQGPIIAMIENYRSGVLWRCFMENEDVIRGLGRLGFSINGSRIHPSGEQNPM